MGDNTGIQWTDATWNLWTGCTKVSPACANCYIDRQPPFRMAARKFVKGHIPLQFHMERMDVPLRWTRQRMIFVNSLSDTFHADVPDDYLDELFAVMGLARRHIFQVLTKRELRQRLYTQGLSTPAGTARLLAAAVRVASRFPYLATRMGEWEHLLMWPFPNVWGGVSAENQRMWDLRVPELLDANWWLRWVSSEPLLSEINMRETKIAANIYLDPLTGCHHTGVAQASTVQELLTNRELLPTLPRRKPGIDWVVFGGESGPIIDLRALNLAHVRSGLKQCRAVGVPAFVKQMGEVPAYEHTGALRVVLKCQDRKGGNPMEWPEEFRVREWPQAVAA